MTFRPARSVEGARHVRRRLDHKLKGIAPDDGTRTRCLEHAHGQAALAEKPCAIMRAGNRLPERWIKPAHTPSRAPSSEMTAEPIRNRQVLVEPVDLAFQFVANPLRPGVVGKEVVGLKEAGFHPALRMNQRGHETHIHDDVGGALALPSCNSDFGVNVAALRRRQPTTGGRLRRVRPQSINIAISAGMRFNFRHIPAANGQAFILTIRDESRTIPIRAGS